jgi:type IV secretion system protein VirD4
MGRELVTCLLAHMLWDQRPELPRPSLKEFAKGMALSEEDMPLLLQEIHRTSNSKMARRIASQLMACKADETFSGIYMNAVKGTAWLGTEAYADLVSEGSFDPRQLLRGDTTVFLNISLQTLKNTPAVGRVLVGALLNTVYMADGAVSGRVLYLIDEAARLGSLGVLEIARDAGRKYGITLRLLYQSIGQLMQTWTHDGATSWIDACSWISYASIRASGAGKSLSDELGTYGAIAYSEGDNTGRNTTPTQLWGSKSRGTNTNISETMRKLMTAAELQQDMRTDEQIIVPANGLPIRCGRPIYFRRDEIIPLIDRNRFVKGNNDANTGQREKASV